MIAARAEMTLEFFRRFELLVSQIPGQEVWRKHHTEWFATAKPATLLRRVRTKGGYTDLPAGTLVLAKVDRETLGWSIWSTSSRDTTHTIVSEEILSFLCETCEGSQAVFPHPSALLSMPCPSCS